MHLHASTHWGRGAGVISKLLESVILGRAEARKELVNLTALVEREAAG